MKTLLLLALVLSGDDHGPVPGGDAQDPNVLVRYDLRPVLPRLDGGTGWASGLAQLPPPWWHDSPTVDVQGLGEDAAPDAILALVTQILGDELSAKGSQITLESDTHLSVLAPEAVQAKVAFVLDQLESVLSAAVQVHVDVVSGKGPGGAALPAKGVVPVAEADRMIAALEARGAAHEELELQLRAGRTAAIGQSRTVPLVYDYDVEIAQGSFMYDPIVFQVMDGLRLFVRGVPGASGTRISVLLLQGDLVGGVQDEKLELRGTVGYEKTGGLTFVGGPEALQTFQVLTRSMAFTSFLPEGQAIVIGCETRLGGDDESQLIVMRQVGGGAPAYASSAIRGTSRTLTLVDSELLRAPGFDVVTGRVEGHPFVTATLTAETSAFLYDWLRYRYTVSRTIGPWAVVVSDPSWDARGAEAIDELVKRAGAPAKLLDVHVELVAGGEEAVRPVRWSLPVLEGTSCAAVLGVSSTAVADYDVEVAQFAGVPDPVVQATFSGLALGLEVSRGGAAGDGGSTWVLDARGTGQRLRGPMTSFEPAGPMMARVDQPQYDVLELNERVRLTKQGAGAGTTIGPLSRKPDQGGLGLVVSIGE